MPQRVCGGQRSEDNSMESVLSYSPLSGFQALNSGHYALSTFTHEEVLPTNKSPLKNQKWWHLPVILTLERLGQKDQNSKSILNGSIVSSRLVCVTWDLVSKKAPVYKHTDVSRCWGVSVAWWSPHSPNKYIPGKLLSVVLCVHFSLTNYGFDLIIFTWWLK